jgi:hypothetical protein
MAVEFERRNAGCTGVVIYLQNLGLMVDLN